MMVKNIVLNRMYHKSDGKGYLVPIEILKPRKKPNPLGHTIIVCDYYESPDSMFYQRVWVRKEAIGEVYM